MGPNPLRRKILQNVSTQIKGNRYYLKFSNEGVGANDIEGGNTENSVGIVDAGLLENFTGDWDSAVDLIKKKKFTMIIVEQNIQIHTGLEMIPIKALGQTSAQATAKSRTIEALMLKRSSRVMPGLRGTPAGMMTTSQPSRELYFNKNENKLFEIHC